MDLKVESSYAKIDENLANYFSKNKAELLQEVLLFKNCITEFVWQNERLRRCDTSKSTNFLKLMQFFLAVWIFVILAQGYPQRMRL